MNTVLHVQMESANCLPVMLFPHRVVSLWRPNRCVVAELFNQTQSWRVKTKFASRFSFHMSKFVQLVEVLLAYKCAVSRMGKLATFCLTSDDTFQSLRRIWNFAWLVELRYGKVCGNTMCNMTISKWVEWFWKESLV